MEKFMPKISPTMKNIRKSFKKVGIIFLFVFFLLWFIHQEAARVHEEIYGKIHTLEYLHEGEHGK